MVNVEPVEPSPSSTQIILYKSTEYMKGSIKLINRYASSSPLIVVIRTGISMVNFFSLKIKYIVNTKSIEKNKMSTIDKINAAKYIHSIVPRLKIVNKIPVNEIILMVKIVKLNISKEILNL
jgi:hypothetical protein